MDDSFANNKNKHYSSSMEVVFAETPIKGTLGAVSNFPGDFRFRSYCNNIQSVKLDQWRVRTYTLAVLK